MAKAQVKVQSLRNNQGKTKKKGSEGSTNQNVPEACTAISSVSRVSRYSQIIPRMDNRGNEAIKAPRLGAFFDSSEITTIRNALMITLKMGYRLKIRPTTGQSVEPPLERRLHAGHVHQCLLRALRSVPATLFPGPAVKPSQ